jgi:hypothetical protein
MKVAAAAALVVADMLFLQLEIDVERRRSPQYAPAIEQPPGVIRGGRGHHVARTVPGHFHRNPIPSFPRDRS